ncbi:uncharacterized protein F5891DRAFT_1063645 [Suillus fuscotomentosus]|uniref:THIF-type NAD/FAD binding fold domain-containing protein n=1 Tax=Suillus fuscotomentosus TaxID=1912939 RepID=A0AAD4DUH4_9AGAM|nr:uncharacterized protein F5891DRAFT_1063645 [Suillus fuscotomentosus]KAG1894170.1 hypothetical protein F5891DRAFT_1063645 [Suillus fuscotomentosus]
MDTHYEGRSKGDPVQITEDEAAVYDRQIRLWGLEAQQRMCNATILVIRLRGTATEAIKNIVLAGIGKLVIYDSEEVKEEDLGAGFFFRDEDVGEKRVDAAKARIEALNPLVTVQALRHSTLLEQGSLEALIMSVDLVCIKINDICRQFGKSFYAGGTYIWLACSHDYISPKVTDQAHKEAPKNVKATASYSRLSTTLQLRWIGLTKRQTKELNPAVVHIILGKLPDDIDATSELGQVANSILASSDVNRQVLTSVPPDLIDAMSTSAVHEFSPTCADILKALATREAPIANFFTFDGNTGGGSVCRMSM